ncbi:MAG: hypothetical protein IKH58_00100 [Bacteroidales bacterium]|nr:hypothetical protein [Bacteroidales bacterium]
MKKLLLYFMTALMLLHVSSCTTLKPMADSVSDPDYNRRIKVTNPRYKKKPNAIGYTIGIGLPIVGAAGGYMSDLVKTQDSDGIRKESKIGGAGFGLLVGTGLSYLASKIGGYHKNVRADNYDRWADKAGGNYVCLRNDGSTVTFIDKLAEKDFEVRNINDVADFANAFPNSYYAENVFSQGLKKLGRNDLPQLITLLPNCAGVSDAKERYIKESNSFDELSAALKKYPIGTEVQKMYLDLIEDANNAITFKQMYPATQYGKEAVKNAFRTINDVSDIKHLKDVYGNQFNLNKQDLSTASDAVKKNYFNSLFILAPNQNVNTFDQINSNYSWLTYEGKENDVLDKYWDYCNKPSASGKEVLAALGRVAGKVGLRGETVKSFVEKKVAETMQDQLKVISVNTANSTSSEFERWKNAVYTAGVIVDDSSFKVLVYGEVKNNSKFDVPVGVSMSGELYRITKLENSLLGGLVSGLASLAGVSPETRELITALNVHGFTIPILPAGETYPYAIMLDFGGTQLDEATKRGGVNLGDLIKTSSDVQLANVNVHAAFNTEKVSEEQIKKQNEWLLMAQNGLPEANFKDLFRNESLNQNEWDRRWREYSERHDPVGSIIVDKNYSELPNGKLSKGLLLGTWYYYDYPGLLRFKDSNGNLISDYINYNVSFEDEYGTKLHKYEIGYATENIRNNIDSWEFDSYEEMRDAVINALK